MPRSTDSPEPNRTLNGADDPPELNPLLNPLLGAHMDRWAEAYFTNPPEKRDQAVIELLRQLVAESQAQFNHRAQPDRGFNDRGFNDREFNDRGIGSNDRGNRTRPRSSPEREQACASCGVPNPLDQKFCGMCGTELSGAELYDAERSGPQRRAAEIRPVAALNLESRGMNPELEEYPPSRNHAWPNQPSPIQPSPKSNGGGFSFLNLSEIAPPERTPQHQDSWRENAWSTDPTANDGPSLMPEYAPESYRYRIYLGVALALLLSVFIYMAWRSTLAGRSASHQLSPPVPVEAPETVAQPASASNEPAPATSAPGKASTVDSAAKAASTPPPSVAHPKVAQSSRESLSAEPPSAAQTSPATSARGNGAEELAIALSYLNGAPGKARDDGEAAKWLWKSVAKHNDTAALMLSDLYLRGSGVGKNCDQARLLLDAAAKKNVAGAAERLRNLQAFSCQ